MSRIVRRLRPKLAAGAGSVAVIAIAAAYIVERATGLHPQAPAVIASVAGLLAAAGLRAVTRKDRGTPVGQRGTERQIPPEPAPEVVLLAQQGSKIQAIKRYRELNPGTGLKEAKDVIDTIVSRTRDNGPDQPSMRKHLRSRRQSRSR